MNDPFPICYRHGPKKGQPVSLRGLIGDCEVCGQPAERLVSDRVEVNPQQNFLGLWCRVYAAAEPPHRYCEQHYQPGAVRTRFSTDEAFREWTEMQNNMQENMQEPTV